MGNSLIFPVPKCNYTASSLQPFYQSIPISEEQYSVKKCCTKKLKRIVPALHIKAATKSKYLIIYFHGNGVDLGGHHNIMLEYYEHFQIDILAPEYPGYGIYKTKTSARKIISDAQHIIDYAIRADGLNYSAENVIVIGRSLGAGVAIQVAARYPMLKAVILISAFTSVRDIANNVAGALSKIIIPDIFKSIDTMNEITVPTLFIHGIRDEFIPYGHSIKLHEKCGSAKKKLELREGMDHNRCKFEKDIFEPIENFLLKELLITDLRSLKLKFLCFERVPQEKKALERYTMQHEKCPTSYCSIIDVSESLPNP